MSDLREQLQAIFGLDEFRPAQREVIQDVLDGHDVMCVMPTGAGKSLCYQFPAAVQNGLTLVVSPLISLMEDQVQQLRDENIPAAMLNSSMSPSMQRQVIQELEHGFDGLLYVAPERLFRQNFQSLLQRLKIKLFVIDEAHCISQWGHDFRPEYSRLGEIRKLVGSPTTIAVTATATDDVRRDIVQLLELNKPRIYVTGFDRPNLRYGSRSFAKVRDKDDELVKFLRTETGSGIVYCATRKNVDAVTALLSAKLLDRSVFAYHAGMDPAARTANQEQFMQTARAIAVATNAFGMGINKPDIRWVVHYNMPGTLEAYYQEAGRAGRDGRAARCDIFFNYQDRYTQEFFIDQIGEDNPGSSPALIARRQEHARENLEFMVRYAQTHRCRRQQILDYFGDESEVADCHCDVCRREREPQTEDETTTPVSDEVVLMTRQMLSAIARLNGNFGVGVIAEVLAGSWNEKTQRWGFQQLSVYGLLKAHSIKRLVAMLHRLMEAGLAKQRDPDGMKFRPVVELTASGVAVMKGEQLPPASLADLLPRAGAYSSNQRVVRIDEDVAEPMSPDASARFERLRSVRSALAKEKQLPPYCICHDSTLRTIARQSPNSLEALSRIKGIGPSKLEAYGKQLLQAISDSQVAAEEMPF